MYKKMKSKQWITQYIIIVFCYYQLLLPKTKKKRCEQFFTVIILRLISHQLFFLYDIELKSNKILQ